MHAWRQGAGAPGGAGGAVVAADGRWQIERTDLMEIAVKVAQP
jgi:hypothetical protein